MKEGLQAVRINEWRPKPGGETTLEKIEMATKSYLKQGDIRSLIQRCEEYSIDK